MSGMSRVLQTLGLNMNYDDMSSIRVDLQVLLLVCASKCQILPILKTATIQCIVYF